MLHAREFVEKRQDSSGNAMSTADNNLLNKSNLSLLSGMLNKMQAGIYLADLEGKVIYTNIVLENWLSYKANEIVQSNLTLRDIIWQEGMQNANIIQQDYNGVAMLRGKNGEKISALINQKTVRDDENRVLGAIAIIHNVNLTNTATAKKSW